MTIQSLIEELDRLAFVFRLEKKSQRQDEMPAAKVQLGRIRKAVDEMPDASVVHFRKIVLVPPQELASEYEDLKHQMRLKGLHIG